RLGHIRRLRYRRNRRRSDLTPRCFHAPCRPQRVQWSRTLLRQPRPETVEPTVEARTTNRGGDGVAASAAPAPPPAAPAPPPPAPAPSLPSSKVTAAREISPRFRSTAVSGGEAV